MYKKESEGILRYWDFMLIEMISLYISVIAASYIRNGIYFDFFGNDIYLSVALFSEIGCIFAAIFFRSMNNILKRGFLSEIRATATQMLTVLLLDALFLFSAKISTDFSRIVLYIMIGLYGALSLCLRCLWKKLMRRRRPFAARKLLVIVSEDTAAETLRSLGQASDGSYCICGAAFPYGLSDDKTAETGDVPVVAQSEDELADYIRSEWVDAVFISLGNGTLLSDELAEHLTVMGITVHYRIPPIYNDSGNSVVEEICGCPVVTSSIKTVDAGQLFIKRCIDIIGGIIGCILTGIIFIFLAPAIKISSPGTVFFKQERIGQNGKRFKMYKFRSMHMNADELKKELMAENRIADGMMFKLDFDPRIIGCRKRPDGTVKKGLGNFIRETSLDEFPQFFNVLKGEMSLVGTRPPTPDEWEKYSDRHRIRMSVKPGITGIWQISGRSSITDFEEVVKADKKYITEWSLALDIKILFKTIAAVFGRKGSM